VFGRKRRDPVEVRSEETPTGGRRSVATSVREVPLDLAFRAATDYEHYAEFMPRTVEARVESRTEDEVVFQTALDFLVKRVRYRLRLALDRAAGRVTWSMIDGDLARCEGSWQFEDLGGGKTRITYTTWIEVDYAIPKRALNKLVGASLPDVIERTVERARALGQSGA